MTDNEKTKKCPEYCPFLKANNTFCVLFKRSLRTAGDIGLRCEECKNPEQRFSSYKELGLTEDNRIEMWQNAVSKHNEIELGKKRQEEDVRKKFAAMLEEKYGARPPLAGNEFLQNLVINLYMVLDSTERQIMQTLLGGRNGNTLLEAIERMPKDQGLLRNVRRELDEEFLAYQRQVQEIQKQNTNTNSK
ncbi:MAG: hypothetical protein J6Y91_03675 [Alphaproteobacteria bacterium]|nr:hypothetical protein [Alphaproteobacteria bacterium]